MTRVAFFYATFPRPTETFVRRELRAFKQIGFNPDLYSIWKGHSTWEGKQVYRFKFARLLSLFFWIPYWSWRKPKAFKEILNELLKKPCPSLQNWNETFLALGFALVEASNFKVKNYSLIHGIWATMPATATLALSKLIDVPFSMGAHAYDVFRTGGDWLLELKFRNAVFIRTSSQSTVRRIEQIGVLPGKVKLIRRGLASWPVRNNFLLKEINRLGLIENVIVLGSKSQKETREIYLNSDAFIFTGIIAKDGDRDGIPNVIPEAMSAGCLILASSHAGASEAFIEDVSGFSLNPKDTQMWVSILKEFLEEPESFQLMRKRAIKHTKQAFDVLQTAHSFHSVIEKNLDS